MTTIDKLDISVYDLYAKRQIMVEQINQQLRLQEAQNIPAQTQILNLNPELTQLDILLGVVRVAPPWAYFLRPQSKTKLRRSPFVSYRVASTLGSLEEQAALYEAIQNQDSESEDEKERQEEEEEKQTILNCLKQLDILNEWQGYIFGRKGQFLQG